MIFDKAGSSNLNVPVTSNFGLFVVNICSVDQLHLGMKRIGDELHEKLSVAGANKFVVLTSSSICAKICTTGS